MTLAAESTTTEGVQPRAPREIYAALSGLVIAMLLALLDNLVVGTAMPTIVGDLGGMAHLSWVVTAYTLMTAMSTPLWAKLGDLYGRKGVFMASIVIFLLGSALSGLSRTMGELIAFRAIQGLGAGGLMVGAFAIMGDLVPPRERGRYQGILMAVMPLAFIGGPLLGGYLTDHFSWRWAFYINLPLGAVALIVVWFTMHLRGGLVRVKIDWLGAALLAVAIMALTLVASWGGTQYPWNSFQILGLGALTVIAAALFIRVERRVREPVLPLTLFLSRNFTAGVLLSFFTGLAMFSAVTFLPQFQQMVQGASATRSGLLLLPLMGGTMFTSIAGGQIITRTNRYRWQLLIGSVLMTGGLGLLATMDVGTSRSLSALYMILLGAGMGCVMQTSTLIVQNSAEHRNLGAATGAATLFRTIGGSLGISLLGALYAHRLQATLVERLGDAVGNRAIGGRLTPALLNGLPPYVHEAFRVAVSSGIGQVFLWASLITALAIGAAGAIKEVPLRGAAKSAKATGDI